MSTTFCAVSGDQFDLSSRELAFLERINAPMPTVCPSERRRRRLSRRNERALYRRKCDSTGKSIMSIYPEDVPFPVYRNDFWWGDHWDALHYGRDFDFNRSFFEQFAELQAAVPRPSLNNVDNENCEYVNQCGFSKNCYLSFNTDYCEDCIYCGNTIRSKDCVDCLNIDSCELCYELIDCADCYGSTYLRDCYNCASSHFLKNCIGCMHCFGSVNLRNKQYYLFNKKYSKTEYFALLEKLQLGSYRCREELLRRFRDIVSESFLPFAEIRNCEDVVGDYLRNCRGAFRTFDSHDDHDVLNCTVVSGAKDIGDFDIGGYGAELCYEIIGSGDRMRNCFWSSNIWGNAQDILYSDIMYRVRDCFGCVSLRNQEYCILNKKCSETEYFQLKEKIISHMKRTGEYGEFFPADISPFPYASSLAAEFDQRSHAQTENAVSQMDETLPDSVTDADDQVLQLRLTCEVTGKQFKIQAPELAFYRKMNIALPRKCANQRHSERRNARNPYHLWSRTCYSCSAPFWTTYAPERTERIVCEKCYPNYLN